MANILKASDARARFAASPVARLGTTGPDGQPHLVPCTFALLGDDTIVSAVDDKPKRTRALRRLANIADRPRVSLLVDHYEEDWTRLWWARADGLARVAEIADMPGALEALCERYAPYREKAPAGPLVVIAVERWSSWRAA